MNTYLYANANSLRWTDQWGLSPQKCSDSNKEKDKEEKCKKGKGKAAIVAYYLCRLLSQGVDDAQEGGASPKRPKGPAPDVPENVEPHDTPTLPIDPDNPTLPRK